MERVKKTTVRQAKSLLQAFFQQAFFYTFFFFFFPVSPSCRIDKAKGALYIS